MYKKENYEEKNRRERNWARRGGTVIELCFREGGRKTLLPAGSQKMLAQLSCAGTPERG
jgi:hypothetical protein